MSTDEDWLDLIDFADAFGSAVEVLKASAIDQPSSMYLVELALDMARSVLKPGGAFVTKVFHGEGFDDLLKDTRTSFTNVRSRKPDASRGRSREVYQLATGFKGQ